MLSVYHGNVCSAINCSNNQKNSPELSFFRFPKDPERSRKWLINSRRYDLSSKDVHYLYNNIKFCSLHFEDNQFMNTEKKKLVWNAVPTVFDVPNRPPRTALKGKLPTRIDAPIPEKLELPKGIDCVDPVPTCSTEEPSTNPTGADRMDGLKKEKKKRSGSTREELMALSKEELVEQVLKLEAYNFQLKNVLNKQLSGADAERKESSKKQRAFDFSKCTRRHVALRLLYLGWDYHGLSSQEWTHQTIEHHLFAALTKSCLIESRQTSNYHRCGRTDKGVSAFCQVISIDLRSSLTQEQIDAGMTAGEMPYAKILNRLLPEDMRVLSWRPVASDFSARFDCTSRTYKYFFPRGNLDIAQMNEAVQYVVGTHDFRNLCKLDVKNGVTNYVRSVNSADVRVSCPDPGGDLSYDMCELTLSGKAFLWHQVRCIMGILLLVGGGHEHPDVVKELLEVGERPHKPQYNLASELPLNLFCCDYEGLSQEEVVDEEAQREVVQTLQRKWAEYTVQATMVRSMLSHLPAATAQSNWLLQGVKPKLYCPLLLRPTCDSVEGRIQHFAKKRKIEMSDDSAGDADTKTSEVEEGDE